MVLNRLILNPFKFRSCQDVMLSSRLYHDIGSHPFALRWKVQVKDYFLLPPSQHRIYQCQGSNSINFVSCQINSQPKTQPSTPQHLPDFHSLFKEVVYFYRDHRNNGSQWTGLKPAAAVYSPRLPGAWGGNVFSDAHEYPGSSNESPVTALVEGGVGWDGVVPHCPGALSPSVSLLLQLLLVLLPLSVHPSAQSIY